jgi:hypothetical protein
MKAGWLVILSAAVVLAPAAAQDRQPGVRFHHLHFRSDDPADSMAAAIRAAGGTRAIVPGLGVGVRVADANVLFDRPDATGAPRPRSLRDAVQSAARWLDERKIAVRTTEAGERLLASALNGELDHVAFATDDPKAVEEALRLAGALPARRTTDSAFYLDGDLPIEITAETDRPDRFWCPMHPHIRSAGPQVCPICSMALVPIAPPRVGAYRMDVTQVPASGGGVRGLRLRIRDPDSREDVAMFAETHERLLHLFVVGRDLRFFAHEHPERTRDGFELKLALPPGAYMLIADFLPGGGYPQMVHRAIVTPGYRGSAFRSPDIAEDLVEKTVDGMRFRLRVDAREGKPSAVLHFRLTDVNGLPVADLEPYLGSAAHLLVVSPDLTQSIHAHPEARGSGPELSFDAEFPEPGLFKLWLQVQRGGKVSVVSFVVEMR